jgi:hypothetical protein
LNPCGCETFTYRDYINIRRRQSLKVTVLLVLADPFGAMGDPRVSGTANLCYRAIHSTHEHLTTNPSSRGTTSYMITHSLGSPPLLIKDYTHSLGSPPLLRPTFVLPCQVPGCNARHVRLLHALWEQQTCLMATKSDPLTAIYGFVGLADVFGGGVKVCGGLGWLP